MTRATRSSAVQVEPTQPSSPPSTPRPPRGKKRKGTGSGDAAQEASPNKAVASTSASTRKRARPATIKHEDVDDQSLDTSRTPDTTSIKKEKRATPLPKKAKSSRKSTNNATPKKEETDSPDTKVTAPPSQTPKKKAKGSYGLTPGQTPYPNWPHPTPEECEEVVRLLSSVHGRVSPPKDIPTPSLTVSGCGEVPSVLDALIRTRLSAATSNTNSSRAFAGLVSKFGILKEGVGKGSVDWNKVRLANTKDIFEAIKSGGLADVKSKDIKKILQMVWEENQARREALLASKDSALGSAKEDPAEKNVEIAKAEENVLSLDHLHLLSNDDAFNAMTKYPGIGPKTASCVLLFCLQRPSFAVDTHVFRLCQWLGWVPPPGDPAGLAPGAKIKFAGPTRNSTYAHCEVRIPDNLKYPLHKLFIKHGRTCPRCRAITGESSEGWEKGCVIDHLVNRTGVRKELGASPTKPSNGVKRPAPKKRKIGKYEEDTESEISDLSDLGSEDEDNFSESSTD